MADFKDRFILQDKVSETLINISVGLEKLNGKLEKAQNKFGEILYFDDYKEKLGERLDVRSYIQRESLIRELSHCDFLINIKNESSVQSPSKLIDYALTHRPILTITSDFNSSYASSNKILLKLPALKSSYTSYNIVVSLALT